MQKIPVSIIIIAKNEAGVIAHCVRSIRSVTDDVVVCDTGSTDKTQEIAIDAGARVETMEWQGYGATKNAANQLAKYEWIFQLDADETVDETLISALQEINWDDHSKAYTIRRKRFFMGKLMRFGAWGNEKKTRIFRRQNARWSHDAVHEKLEIKNANPTLIPGFILDNTFQHNDHFNVKMNQYAQLCAQKYFARKITGAQWKRFLSPLYTFLLNYFLRLGFLDGKEGLFLALKIADYTFKKYNELHRLYKKQSIAHSI
jgi:glycosyltransferase involved in cell wall biosynthesis